MRGGHSGRFHCTSHRAVILLGEVRIHFVQFKLSSRYCPPLHQLRELHKEIQRSETSLVAWEKQKQFIITSN